MTPAGLLVCMTIVTNINHGSVVSHVCHDPQHDVAVVTQNPAPAVSTSTIQMPDREVKAVSFADVAAQTMPTPRHIRKIGIHKVKSHHRMFGKTAKILKPAMTAEQKSSFRVSWFNRLAAN